MHVFSAAERLAWQRATARYLSISPCSSISSATSSHLQQCEEACDHSGGGGRQISEEAAYRNWLSISINPGYGLALPVPAAQVETGVPGGPYLRSCLVRCSSASSVCQVTPLQDKR